MLGTVLVFLLLSENLNAKFIEEADSVEAARRISLLEDELQSLYDRNSTHSDIIAELEGNLSNLYNGEDMEEGRAGKKKKSKELELIEDYPGRWKELQEGVELRYFAPSGAPYSKLSDEEIWAKGRPIYCKVYRNKKNMLKVKLRLDGDVEAYVNLRDYRTRIFTLGFNSKATKYAEFVDAWMDNYEDYYHEVVNEYVNVILVNWPKLAFEDKKRDFRLDSTYQKAAKNAIDVGQYLGRCLAAIDIKVQNTFGLSTQLVGHSLGAHLMGKAARVYRQKTGGEIGRVTGLDPAAPLFIPGGTLLKEIPVLNQNQLTKSSAFFVDVIHTDGSLRPSFGSRVLPHLGNLNPMGHADYYPDGGESQTGCRLPGCSHSRAVKYYLKSIRNPKLYVSYSCENLDKCRAGVTKDWTTYMGYIADDVFKLGTMFYMKINRNHYN